MKSKTSITLSEEVLAGVDRLAGKRYSRSEVIDRILLRFLEAREREKNEAADLEKINRNADYFRREAL